MRSTLLQLYHEGLFLPSSHNDQIAQHRNKRRMCYQKHDDFIAKIRAVDPKLEPEFEKIMEEFLECELLELPETFVEGFRMGAKLMLDIFAQE